MKSQTNHSIKQDKYTITPEGSLGLLALGDIGLRAWREVKERQVHQQNFPND
ncbi:hypothetical protein [Mangrovimonas xylaniphaga]|uniref:hypothetical protein n=1 Tax=Mangrovimonas xylaniphaga TaxID=1645915 RepID=UPI000A9AE7DE|nr:hypothetical protein [Mangrovimonas xylaniphaga]